MILEVLNKDLYEALKSKDSEKLGALRYLVSKIKNKEIELRATGEELTDDDVLSIIKKQIKQRNQSIEGFQKLGRVESVEKEQKELELLESYYNKFSVSEEA